MERVLVVEDDPQLAHLVITALEHEGYTALLATNGLDAVQIAPQADLMILDLGLPGLGGLEVIRELREAGTPEAVAWIADTDRGTTAELCRRFLTVYGSPNFIRTPCAQDAWETALYLTQGQRATAGFDLERATFLLSLGSGLLEGWGTPPFVFRARGALKDNNGRFVQADARLSKTAAKADQWLPILPGSEGTLAFGLIHVLLKEGRERKPFVAAHTAGLEELKRQALQEAFSPEAVAQATGLEAKAVAVVDSDLRSITPEWFDLLLRPVLFAGYDFVAPYYHRHKYDGTITNSIVYPLTRALYGHRVRQPIGGEFGLSTRLINRYLQRDDWETDVARFGIDIWMTTIALAEGFRVCQSFLGAKLHDAKDPSSDLTAMLEQVVGSVLMLMQEYENVWWDREGSRSVELFGFRYDVGLDPIEVNVERMLAAFVRGCRDLGEIWAVALEPETYAGIQALGRQAAAGARIFHLDDELWARVVLDFACAFNKHRVAGGHLIRSLTPLYLARVASFVIETRTLVPDQVEDKIEQLCLVFERLKPYLKAHWDGPGARNRGSRNPESAAVPKHDSEVSRND